MTNKVDIKSRIKSLPHEPGVYRFYDSAGKLLYVGKAKDLYKRVNSYFTKHHDHAKTRVMVSKIKEVEHIVVESETDALLLENSLIKKHQPRYNIMLKDDKTYPWICIKKEPFPRVFLTRNVIRDGSEYFGPYTSVRTARALLSLIKELYPLRTCRHHLSEENISAGKFKVCLDYHIGTCLGPCVGKQTSGEYLNDIEEVRKIIKGHFKEAIKKFEVLMHQAASRLEFEEAQRIKEKIQLLSKYQAKSTVVNPKITDVDVFSIYSDESYAYVNFFKVVNGAIVQSHTAEIKKKLDEPDISILELSIIQLRERYGSTAPEILVPFSLTAPPGIKVSIPKIGEKKHLLDLSLRNARYHRLERIKQQRIADPEKHTRRVLEQMKKDLNLPKLPVHIECFDNSNIQGKHPVAACVVFKNAKPSKKDYRKFRIKTVVGPDDFASMEEVVFRRYKSVLENGESIPQLIIIDGGKGQLSSAVKSLNKLNLTGKIPVIGIAKRLEEIYFPGDPYPLHLDKRSETLKLIQRLRDEAHRFGITYHRRKRMKSALQTELENIPGIGPKTIELLLKQLKSAKRIKSASLDELSKLVGVNKAQRILHYFDK
jgi:excinuclease ABC subunit C